MKDACECYSEAHGFNTTCGSCAGSGVPGNTRIKQLLATLNDLNSRIAELEAQLAELNT
jgi:hypothetical protein